MVTLLHRYFRVKLQMFGASVHDRHAGLLDFPYKGVNIGKILGRKTDRRDAAVFCGSMRPKEHQRVADVPEGWRNNAHINIAVGSGISTSIRSKEDGAFNRHPLLFEDVEIAIDPFPYFFWNMSSSHRKISRAVFIHCRAYGRVARALNDRLMVSYRALILNVVIVSSSVVRVFVSAMLPFVARSARSCEYGGCSPVLSTTRAFSNFSTARCAKKRPCAYRCFFHSVHAVVHVSCASSRQNVMSCMRSRSGIMVSIVTAR